MVDPIVYKQMEIITKLRAENTRLQKEMEEAKQVIILLKFDCEELSKQEFPNVLTSIEMAIAFLAKYGKEQK